MNPATLFPIVLLASVAVAGAASAASASDAKALDPVRQKFAAFNRHDAAAIERLYASDATLHSPDYPNLQGNGPIADTYRKIFAAIPDAQDQIETLEASPQHVYVQFVLTGHYGGAQDKPVRVRLIAVYTMQNGRIRDDATYYDRKMP